ncbi:MAG TPA: hypothetical protein VIL46_02955, partial [Gemmataceae bacterium]
LKVFGTAGLWLVGLLLLYLRYGAHLPGRRLAVLTIAAFALMVVTLAAAHPLAEKSEMANPKSEPTSKPQIQTSKPPARTAPLSDFGFVSDFGFRICFGFRISDFGFRISPRSGAGFRISPSRGLR